MSKGGPTVLIVSRPYMSVKGFFGPLPGREVAARPGLCVDQRAKNTPRGLPLAERQPAG